MTRPPYHDDASRGNSADRGYDRRWRKVRALKAKRDPLCEVCRKRGVVKALDVVHHNQSIEDAPELRLAMDNLMSLCRDCHEIIHGRLTISGCDVNGLPIDSNHVWNKR